MTTERMRRYWAQSATNVSDVYIGAGHPADGVGLLIQHKLKDGETRHAFEQDHRFHCIRPNEDEVKAIQKAIRKALIQSRKMVAEYRVDSAEVTDGDN